MTIETVEGRKAAYLAALRETGSHVRARKAAGVGARAVGLWRDKDEVFAEDEVEAAEFAIDTVVQASRAAALAGDSSQMTNWMKLARPELRPASSVNVGVAVNSGAQAKLDDAALAEAVVAAVAAVESRMALPALPMGEVVHVAGEAQEVVEGAGATEVAEARQRAVDEPQPPLPGWELL